ncbi:MAG: glycosyltransferase [Nostoc sp. ChiSLP02]|nr:glycosyltransferase [Nostoc sp. DedSLP05]MDZ8102287.1 glycosyltransferase [Nostoc sp. DedSLP01]MDZ8187292.1 glycosyltransferase [Nostoc sp. ChiSLP02]
MIFDLDIRGHHPGYIQHLIKYWSEQELPGQLDIVVSPKFVQKHSGIVDIAADSSQGNIKFVPITLAEEANLIDSQELDMSFTGRIKRGFQEWKLIHKYATSLNSDRCLLMYIDTILLRLSLGVRFPCSFSGIYFRPVFHYNSFTNYTPSKQELIWELRDKFCLSRLLKNSRLQTLFCLDPFAVEHINVLQGKTTARYLPDPVQLYPASENRLETLKNSLGINPNRKIFLLFGVLTKRKGIDNLLEAVASLPPELCQQLCLLLIGPSESGEQEKLQARVAQISQFLPIQIICRHDFITDEEIQPYFQISDVILAPYQRHIGMSAILVRAAAAQKPVLCSDFGLMGEIARCYGLGLVVDSTKPSEIAKGLVRFLTESPENLCNSEKMQQFYQQNLASKFAQTVFQHLQTI